MQYIMPERELPFRMNISNLIFKCKSFLTLFLTIKIYFVKKTLHIKRGGVF